MDLYFAGKIGEGNSYISPDPHFISTVLLFTNSLPWGKFEKFFEAKKLLNITAAEQLTLLRLISLQEILCINDDALLKWAKNQLYLFGFMQAEFQPRLPTEKLLCDFRQKFDEVGLLKPFRKQCQRLIQEHENRYPMLNLDGEIGDVTQKTNMNLSVQPVKSKVSLRHIESMSDSSCPSCGSKNVIRLAPTNITSSLPKISFSRCRFCGNTYRDDN